MTIGGRPMARALVLFALMAAAVALVLPAIAESASPQAFVDAIYRTYRGTNAQGIPLSNDAVIRRYFAPALANAIIRDRNIAKKAGEVPELNGDPFVDAQDWDIADVKVAVKITGATTAVAVATFLNGTEPRTVTLDLVNTANGWRITNIRSRTFSLRGLYKLK
jgi:Protein of unknown function (DUF3828)